MTQPRKKTSSQPKTAPPDTPVSTNQEDRDILDVNQAADYLGVARSTLYKLIQRGQVPHMKIGGAVRFSRRILLEWVESKSKKSVD